MYGIVNLSFVGFVTSQYSAEKWAEVASQSGHPDTQFEPFESYPDKISYDIVGAAATVLGVTFEEFLEGTGEYWVLVTAKENYESLLKLAGSDLPTFLMSLNNLHERAQSIFPHYSPPSFRCEPQEEGCLRLLYFSEREGLAPFVTGALRGLAKRFNVEIEIDHRGPDPKESAEVFILSWTAE
ncbi:MAG: heme NO-binding domain-containing protein [Planctomycetota bacterium]|jgi:hypothetical protein|nr:heme NO-binding domain-containing protein [Planctomycetota bacterium]